MGQTTDFYAILGIPRGADDREIKKAYFRLVRQYSPETQPEEFKRIREAYEVLQNPAARRDYDQVTQFGAAVGGLLRSGMEAMERGDLRGAQEEFLRVLRDQPDLHFARDLLGMAYLNNNQPKEALRCFDEVIAATEGAAVHLHKGYAHYALDQYDRALLAYGRARELDRADTRVLVALADCYTAMDRYEDALRELDLAIHLHGEVDFQDFVFLMRRVQIQLLRDRTDLAEQEIDQIARILPKDPEIRKYVAQKLSALASQLFRIKRSSDGNRILQRVQQLGGPNSERVLIFPARATQKLRDLPKASQECIVALSREASPYKLTQGVWGGPLVLILAALLSVVMPLYQAGVSRVEWHENTYALMAILLLGGPAFLLFACQRLARVLGSRVGRFTTIHPLYLLQVDVDQVTAWPLVNLHDVSMTHHLQNGVYQYTAVKVDFAGVNLTLTIRGQQLAADWAQALLDARHRCLGLLGVGMLEEEEGYHILPGAMLLGKLPVVPLPRQVYRQYAVAAAMGAMLLCGGTAWNGRAAERSAWTQAAGYPRAGGYRYYLDLYPRGPHAEEAREALDRVYDEAKEGYQRQVGDAPGKQAIVDVLETLKASRSQAVWVRYQGTVDMMSVRAQALPDGTTPLPPERAFTGPVNRQREAAITQSLSGAFQRVLAPDVLLLQGFPPRPGKGERLAVTFDVSYKVSSSGEVYRSTTDRRALYGIKLDWTLRIETPRTRAQGGTPYTIELHSQPAQSIRYLPQSYDDEEILPYTKMAESAFEEFGRKVAAEFGVSIPEPLRPALLDMGKGRSERSGSRLLDERGLSPDVRRLLLDMARRRHEQAALPADGAAESVQP